MAADPSDPASLEKQIDSEHASTAPSPRHAHAVPGGERPAVSLDLHLLPEEEAIQLARQFRHHELPIVVTFPPNDKDNPRSWPAWRKWYITCFVSMLNVLTYVGSMHHSIIDCLTEVNEQVPLCRRLQLWQAAAHYGI